MDTIDEILACLRAWEPDVRFVGNVLTGEAIEAIERLVSELAEAQEKALRFDLDSAGIERREQEATELVTLRAELAEYKRDAERYRTALEQIVAPFEDLNFVSGNKLLTYIHDTATAALAAEGEK